YRVNTISNYLTTATSVLLALVVTPILVHGLGRTEYGVWVLVGSILVYIELLNLGLDAATVKYVAHYHALGDHERVRRTIASSCGTCSHGGSSPGSRSRGRCSTGASCARSRASPRGSR